MSNCKLCKGKGYTEVHQPGHVHYETDAGEGCPAYHYKREPCSCVTPELKPQTKALVWRDDRIAELERELAERAAHAEELAALLATDVCDVCCGKGDPGTGKPCVCGGTGKASLQAAGFRGSISALHRQLDAAEREVERQQSGWSIEIAERHKERDAHTEELRRVEQEHDAATGALKVYQVLFSHAELLARIEAFNAYKPSEQAKGGAR